MCSDDILFLVGIAPVTMLLLVYLEEIINTHRLHGNLRLVFNYSPTAPQRQTLEL